MLRMIVRNVMLHIFTRLYINVINSQSSNFKQRRKSSECSVTFKYYIAPFLDLLFKGTILFFKDFYIFSYQLSPMGWVSFYSLYNDVISGYYMKREKKNLDCPNLPMFRGKFLFHFFRRTSKSIISAFVPGLFPALLSSRACQHLLRNARKQRISFKSIVDLIYIFLVNVPYLMLKICSSP